MRLGNEQGTQTWQTKLLVKQNLTRYPSNFFEKFFLRLYEFLVDRSARYPNNVNIHVVFSANEDVDKTSR